MIPTTVRIFVCTERQDMRRSFDALALVVQERLVLDPQSGACQLRQPPLRALVDFRWRVGSGDRSGIAS